MHLIVDIVGVYQASGDGMHLHPVIPMRVIDSRSGLESRPRWDRSRPKWVTSNIGDAHTHALVMNVTGVPPTLGRYLSVAPGTVGRPSTSSVNLPAGGVVANMVMCGLDTSLRFAV